MLTGTHLATLPRHYIEHLVEKGQIRIILEQALSYSIELFVITNRYRKNEKLISTFTRSLLAHLSDHGRSGSRTG